MLENTAKNRLLLLFFIYLFFFLFIGSAKADTVVDVNEPGVFTAALINGTETQYGDYDCIRLYCDVTTETDISVGKKIDLNGHSWNVNNQTVTASEGQVFDHSQGKKGKFGYSGSGIIRFRKAKDAGMPEGEEKLVLVYDATDQEICVYTDSSKSVISVKGDKSSISKPKEIKAIIVNDNTWLAKKNGDYGQVEIEYLYKYYDDKTSKPAAGKIITQTIENNNPKWFFPDCSLDPPETTVIEMDNVSYSFSKWTDTKEVKEFSFPSVAYDKIVVVARYEKDDEKGGFPGAGGRGIGGWSGLKGMFSSGSQPGIQQAEATVQETKAVEKTQAQPTIGHVSKAVSKTSVKFEDGDRQGINLEDIIGMDKKEEKSPPYLVIGIAAMVIAAIGGVIVITKKH